MRRLLSSVIWHWSVWSVIIRPRQPPSGHPPTPPFHPSLCPPPSIHRNPPTDLRVTALTPRMHNTRSHRVRPQTTHQRKQRPIQKGERGSQLWGPSFNSLPKAISTDHRNDGLK